MIVFIVLYFFKKSNPVFIKNSHIRNFFAYTVPSAEGRISKGRYTVSPSELICPRPSPEAILATLLSLSVAYTAAEVIEVGKSLEGRSLCALRIGRGSREVLYVGTHHAMEWHTAVLLLLFAEELLKAKDGVRFGIAIPYLLSTRTFTILPLLNPDGVFLRHCGTREGEVLYERKRRMNGGSLDFDRWQANARGVDLNHNYDAGFAEYKKIEEKEGITAGPTRYSGTCPESEPESFALASLVRTLRPSLILSLHTQGEEIYAGGAHREARFASLGRALGRMSGYRFCTPEDAHAAYGGLADWTGGVLGIPSFTIECGRGKNPLPHTDILPMYRRLRRTLFCAAVN